MAKTSGKPKNIDSQRFVLNRYLSARGLSEVLSLEPNTLETSRGMWRLCAARPVPGIRFVDAEDVWGPSGRGMAGLLSYAEDPNASWIAIIADADRETAALELSAPAWLDPRVIGVGGLLMNTDDSVRWSGGLFLPGGRVFDPYNGQPLATGGYHAQLWCQRCVDVVAPVNALIRTDALRRAAERPGVREVDGLMAMLGAEAQESGNLIAVTPISARGLHGYPWSPCRWIAAVCFSVCRRLLTEAAGTTAPSRYSVPISCPAWPSMAARAKTKWAHYRVRRVLACGRCDGVPVAALRIRRRADAEAPPTLILTFRESTG